MKKLSLRLRLILFFTCGITLTGLLTITISYFQMQSALKEVFNSQQMLFARRLASPNIQRLIHHQAKSFQSDFSGSLKNNKLDRIKYDDDELAFAIFNRMGEMILHDGEDGEDFEFNDKMREAPQHRAMSITHTKKWRILWLPSPNRKYIIAVGQSWEYRDKVIFGLIMAQSLPWLITLTILMLMIMLMINRELAPLNALAQNLKRREPDDASPINQAAPKEVQPLIESMNTLFRRISVMLARERRFTSNAAHELRTPLAALRIQTEVAQLAEADPQTRQQALENMLIGIDRAAYLIDQMLVLSRLNSHTDLIEKEEIHWPTVIEQALTDMTAQIGTHHTVITTQLIDPIVPLKGNSTFMVLLLRNLLDNAIKYTPENSQVNIIIQNNQLIVEDNGTGVTSEALTQLGEQFFRAADQNTPGSGLGLSIVKQIAQLHSAQVFFYQASTGGLGVKLMWSPPHHEN